MRKKFDAIIFDMDGVLVDVTYSYRVAIEKTVNFFLKRKGLPIKATQENVAEIKNLPGFNNDWDATYGLIILLSNGIKSGEFSQAVKTLPSIDKRTNEYKKIKDIFQIFYLGSLLFKRIEKRNPPLTNVPGLILDERCLISRRLLHTLRRINLKLGIVTGRPREEALFAIKNFNLGVFFPENYMVALEDIAKEKPAPDPLLEAKRRMKVEKPIYVGDTVNDVLAAQKAGISCIFVGDKNLGDYQVKNVNEIKEILL